MKRTLTIVLIGAVLSCAGPAISADGPSVEDRLKKLEDQLTQVLKENVELRKELGYDGKAPPVVVKPKGKLQKITLGGYIQANGEFGNAPDSRWNGIEDRFYLRRARLGVQGAFAEQFDFKLEADFGNNSISGKTSYSAQISDAYVNWNRFEWGNLKVGQFKTPYGYEQLLPDTKILTVERSLPNDMLTLSRQIGVGASGDFLEKRLGYSAGVFNGNGVNNGFNDNGEFQYVARLAGRPFRGKWGKQDVAWDLGVNGYVSDDTALRINGFGLDSAPATPAVDNLFTGRRYGWAADTQFKVGRLGVYGEYFQSRFEQDAGPAINGSGWYVMATWELILKRLQAVGKFETFDPNADISGDSTDEWTMGLNYFVKGDAIKLSANYLLGDQPGDGSGYLGRFLGRVQIAF